MDSTEANYLQVCLKAFPKVFKDKYGTSIDLATKVGARPCNLERIVVKQQTTPKKGKKGFFILLAPSLKCDMPHRNRISRCRRVAEVLR